MAQQKPIIQIIDLFCGAGGLSLGAKRAGFDVALALDNDKHALASHARNFPSATHSLTDIASIAPKELLKLANIKDVDKLGIIGGPPCQGFSTIGRQHAEDPRNMLFLKFFGLIKDIKPAFFVAENVPGIMNEKFNSTREKALSLIAEDYHIYSPIKIKASDFGAATTRTRVFFIGFRNNLKPQNDAIEIAPLIKQPTTVKAALAGLPNIRSNWQSEEQGWRPRSKTPKSEFFKKVLGDIPEGTGDTYALKMNRLEYVSGCLGTEHSAETVKRFKKLKAGEKDSIYKTIRLKPDDFCPTLRAGTGPDNGSFQAARPIHYSAHRVITPREAARLQGFPDWFIFDKTKWHSFRQIGNSVSPIVSEAIFSAIASKLCK